MSENGGLLDHTDRFLRAKRNLLFWLGITLLVECTHTNETISPEVFGDGLSINPRILTTLMLLVSGYHALGFYYERGIVRLKNNVLTRGRTIRSPDAILDARLSQIETVMQPLPSSLQAVQQTLKSVNEDAKAMEISDLRLSQSVTDLTASMDLLDQMLNVDPNLMAAEKISNYHYNISKVIGYKEALKELTGEFSRRRVRAFDIYHSLQKIEDLEIVQGDLDRLLKANIRDLSQWHATVSGSEITMFRWYDTVAPTVLLCLATIIWLYDLTFYPPPSSLLKLIGG